MYIVYIVGLLIGIFGLAVSLSDREPPKVDVNIVWAKDYDVKPERKEEVYNCMQSAAQAIYSKAVKDGDDISGSYKEIEEWINHSNINEGIDLITISMADPDYNFGVKRNIFFGFSSNEELARGIKDVH